MKTVYLISILLMLFSCQTLSVEKRLYNKGYAISWNRKMKTLDNDPQQKRTITDTNKKQKSSKELADESLTQEERDTFSEVSPSALSELTVVKTVPEVRREIQHLIGSDASGSVKLNRSTVDREAVVETTDSENSKNSKWAFLGLAFPFLVPFFSRRKQQKQLQYWAKNNKNKARWTIAGLSVLGAGSSFLLGDLFSGYAIPELLPASFALVGVSSLLYTTSGNRSAKTKALLGLTASSSLMLFAAGMAQDPVIVDDPRILPLWVSILLTVLTVAMVVGICFVIVGLACTLWCVTGLLLPALLLASVLAYLFVFLGFWIVFTVFKRESERDMSYAHKALLWGFFGILIILSMFLPAIIEYDPYFN